MDPSGAGEIATGKRVNPPLDTATGVDRLSALPNEILVEILFCISSPDAVRTCVLSKRWRSVWKLVPDLHLPFFPEPAGSFRDAHDGHRDKVPLRLRDLKVEGHDHGQGDLPRSIATWLAAAARCVSGSFTLLNKEARMRDARTEDLDAAIELPCFDQATSIWIGLWFRGRLAFLPPAVAGVFSRLTDLWLERIKFQHPSALGDAISSARCPCLKTFHIRHSDNIDKLDVSSTSLEKLDLGVLRLHELTVVAPELKELHVENCMCTRSVVSITAPGLEVLDWRETMTQAAIGFAQQLPHLRSLGSFLFFVYGDDETDTYNRDCLRILQGFQSIQTLRLILMLDINNGDEYLMDTITVLPDLTTLHLVVWSIGHYFWDSSLHVLRICTHIRKLVLELSKVAKSEEACPSDCICRQQSNWQTEELVLFYLQEIEIKGFAQSEHDFGFVEELFGWAISLTKATIFFDESVTEGVAKELCWMFQLFCMPQLHIDFRYHDKKVLFAAEE